MTNVRRSLLFSGLDRYFGQVLLLVTTAAMARILTPAETGLYLVANAFIMLADNFRMYGVGIYIVQEREITQDALRAAFTVTLLLSLLMGGAIFFGADLLAGFYGEPALTHLLSIAALGFLIAPFGNPVIALLQRELAFGSLAIVNIVAALAATIVTIALGLTGFGAASFAWGYVVSTATMSLLAFALRPDPGIFRPSMAGIGRIMSFGTMSVGVTVANMAYDLLPRLALGKILGFDAVGLYGRAVTVCQLPDRALVQAVQPVVLPAMAARARSGGDLKEAYLRGHELMSAFQWPALIMLALLADPVVRVLLGAQWTEAVPLVRIMALATMALAPAFMTYPVLVSLGRIRDTLLSSLVSLPPSVALIILAAFHGLDWVAASLLVVAPIQMLVALLFIRRAIGLEWRELALASRNSALAAIGTAAVPLAVVLAFGDGGALGWLATTAAILGGGGGWLAAILLSGHPLRMELAGLTRLRLRSRRAEALVS